MTSQKPSQSTPTMSQAKQEHPLSKLVLYGDSWSDCGYCHGDRSSLVDRPVDASSQAYTIMVTSLSAQWYETLIGHGWRRSGPAIYKPDNWVSCCPLLSIRLPVQEFTPSKSQRKLLRQASHWTQQQSSTQTSSQADDKVSSPFKKKLKQQISSPKNTHRADSPESKTIVSAIESSGIIAFFQLKTTDALSSILPSSNLSFTPNVSYKVRKPSKYGQAWTLASSICATISGRSGGTIDRTTLAHQLVDALAESSRLWKNEGKTVSISEIQVHEKSGQIIVQLQVNSSQMETSGQQQEAKHKPDDTQPGDEQPQKDCILEWWKKEFPDGRALTDRSITVQTINTFSSALNPDVHKLYAKYQSVVHNDADPFTDDADKFMTSDEAMGEDDPWQSFLKRSKHLLPENAREWVEQMKEMLRKEYGHLPLIRQQRLAHFMVRFCEYYVASPFSTTNETTKVNASTSASPIPCGTYHQLYHINGVLIAIGILDFLPQGLSSVYLVYLPSFSHQVMALGRYCALKEIEYCRDTLKLPYYYLGYYVSDIMMSHLKRYDP